MNGRWWIFMGSAACGGKPTGDCPFPDPTIEAPRGRGVNYLFSTDNFTHGEWKAEHSLYNTSGFVSCPVRARRYPVVNHMTSPVRSFQPARVL